MKISFIILTWNSEKFIQACLHSVKKSCRSEGILDYEIIVIDNGSSDLTKEVIRNTELENVTLIELKENQGTTKTRNIGLKKAKGEYICLLDSDTEIKISNYNAVFSFLEENRAVIIIAPKLIISTGEVQVSVKKFPVLFDKLKRLSFIFFHTDLPCKDHYRDFPFSGPTEVDTAISACWIFRKDIINDIGLFDEKIFYSPEDLDYCIRVWKSGKKVVYYPAFEVLHHTQQICHRNPFGKVSVSHFKDLVYYFWKHKYLLSRKSSCKYNPNSEVKQ